MTQEATEQAYRTVQFTSELVRIMGLPRRTWDASKTFTEEVSALFRLDPTARLRPIQAQALFEFATHRGLFGPIRVGGGKTLITLLAPGVVGAERPLLILPFKLIAKTEAERAKLSRQWRIPRNTLIRSCESFSVSTQATFLDQYRPDCIIIDEAHKFKSLGAGRTKRLKRYLSEHPETIVMAVSGTITKRSIRDFAHIVTWCLKPMHTPVPQSYHDLIDWSDAIDEKKNVPNIPWGALSVFMPPGGTALEDLRSGIRARIVETPGVVATTEGFEGASLQINSLECSMNRDTDEAFVKLRRDWEAPDDWPITSGLEFRAKARELSLGFYYVWDPRPPKPWIEARRNWGSCVRDILGHNRRQIDTPLEVTRAVDKGLYPKATRYLEEWRAIEPTFKPHTKSVWIDDAALQTCKTWAWKTNGIVWVEHRDFGFALSKLSGLDYYGAAGENARGGKIKDHPPGQPMIASWNSNREGENLQAWNQNLLVSPPSSGDILEQLIGRTHRDGQLEDEVIFDVLITCSEHMKALDQARADAEYEQSLSGQAQKLLYADYSLILNDPTGPRFAA